VSQPKPGPKSRKRLTPSEKYEVYVQVLTQQAISREAAEKWGVDRSTSSAGQDRDEPADWDRFGEHPLL
jgi:transposase-like protein